MTYKFPVLAFFLVTSTAMAQVFEVESRHSTIGFEVPIMGGITKVSGKFSRFEATIDYKADEVERSSVDVRIETASIDTGIDRRDKHLRAADFFDAAAHPYITFRSRSIKNKGGGNLEVTGEFSMHGVARELTLPAVVRLVETPDGSTVLTVSLTAEIDRLAFGVGAGFKHDYEKEAEAEERIVPRFIGEKIGVTINLWTNPAAEPENLEE